MGYISKGYYYRDMWAVNLLELTISLVWGFDGSEWVNYWWAPQRLFAHRKVIRLGSKRVEFPLLLLVLPGNMLAFQLLESIWLGILFPQISSLYGYGPDYSESYRTTPPRFCLSTRSPNQQMEAIKIPLLKTTTDRGIFLLANNNNIRQRMETRSIVAWARPISFHRKRIFYWSALEILDYRPYLAKFWRKNSHPVEQNNICKASMYSKDME